MAPTRVRKVRELQTVKMVLLWAVVGLLGVAIVTVSGGHLFPVHSSYSVSQQLEDETSSSPHPPPMANEGNWHSFVSAQDDFMSKAGSKARTRSAFLSFDGSLLDARCRSAVVALGDALRANPYQ